MLIFRRYRFKLDRAYRRKHSFEQCCREGFYRLLFFIISAGCSQPPLVRTGAAEKDFPVIIFLYFFGGLFFPGLFWPSPLTMMPPNSRISSLGRRNSCQKLPRAQSATGERDSKAWSEERRGRRREVVVAMRERWERGRGRRREGMGHGGNHLVLRWLVVVP